MPQCQEIVNTAVRTGGLVIRRSRNALHGRPAITTGFTAVPQVLRVVKLKPLNDEAVDSAIRFIACRYDLTESSAGLKTITIDGKLSLRRARRASTMAGGPAALRCVKGR